MIPCFDAVPCVCFDVILCFDVVPCFDVVSCFDVIPCFDVVPCFEYEYANGTVSTKIYDKRDDFDFDIVNFPLSGWRCPPAYLIWGIHISTYKIRHSSFKS